MSQAPSGNSHKYVIMIIVLVGVLMSVLDGIVVNIALPTITAAFHVDLGLSQWSITGYMVTLTALLLFFGRLSGFTGKVPLFITGFSIFTLASFACGLSTSLTQLHCFSGYPGRRRSHGFQHQRRHPFPGFPAAGAREGHGIHGVHHCGWQYPGPDPGRDPG